MFNWLISPSKSFAEGMEIAFAVGLFLTTLMVVVGLIGEYRKGAWWKRHLHIFEMLVVLGVVGEMFTETGAFWYSLKTQALAGFEIANATKKQTMPRLTLENSALASAICAALLGSRWTKIMPLLRS